MKTFFLLAALLIAHPARAEVIYYHTDALGTPVVATNEQGVVIWRESYTPHGTKLLNQAAAQTETRGFTGHVHDKVTGLTYMGARWYDPELGRFMGVDPKGFRQDDIHSFNPYVYANNNPYKYVDPDGNAPVVFYPMLIQQGFISPNASFSQNIALLTSGIFLFALTGETPLSMQTAAANGSLVSTGWPGDYLVGAGAARLSVGGAATSISAPFKSGDIIVKELSTTKGIIEMAAEANISGRTLHLKDVAIFPKGTDALKLGTKEVLGLRNQLAAEAQNMGFDTLRITGTRYTGAKPGKFVDITIDLGKSP